MSNSSHIYDPMDLESLLLNKEYNELTPEERDFVNEQVDSPMQYHDMQMALKAVVSTQGSELILPREDTKSSLMDQFDRVHQTATKNTWFSFSNPGFRYSLMGSLAVGILAFFLFTPKQPTLKTPAFAEQPIVIEQEMIITQTDSMVNINPVPEGEIVADLQTDQGTYTISIPDETVADVTFFDSSKINEEMMTANAITSNGYYANEPSTTQPLTNNGLDANSATWSTGTTAQQPLEFNGVFTQNGFVNSNTPPTDSVQPILAQSYGTSTLANTRDGSLAGNYSIPTADSIPLQTQSASSDFGQQQITPALAPKNFAKTIELLKLMQTTVDK